MAIFPSTIIQIEEINREVIEGLDVAIDLVFDHKIFILENDARGIIKQEDRIETNFMFTSVFSGHNNKENQDILFLKDDAKYTSFQEFGTKFIEPAFFLTGSFDKNTKDIPQLLDKETQKELDKL